MADSDATPVRKTSARKTPTKKAPAKKAAKKSQSSSTRGSAPRAEADRPSGPLAIAKQAMEQLLQLTGKESEGVVGLEKDGNSSTLR